jgi:hypothetical protein
MNANLLGSIYGRFSTQIAHFVPISYHTNKFAFIYLSGFRGEN